MPLLADILDSTRQTLPALRRDRTRLERVAMGRPAPIPFASGLRGRAVALIAEVKRRSPSAGSINEGLDPTRLARSYAEGGAAAISVLTDRVYFGGSLADLEAVAGAVQVPVLRKDFILDEVQLLEARAAGASAALLIVRALDQPTLTRLVRFAMELELTPLVESHDRGEITRAIDSGTRVLGVNARNLDSFAIDPAAAWRLIAEVPSGLLVVAESGMTTVADVAAAAAAGADAVLIGSALSAAGDPRARARELSGVIRRAR